MRNDGSRVNEISGMREAKNRSVLLITDSLPGCTTSTAPMVESLGEALKASGFEVTVVGIGSEQLVKRALHSVYCRSLKNEYMIVRALSEVAASFLLLAKILAAVATKQIPKPFLVVTFQPSLFLAITTHLLKRIYRPRIYLV